MTKNKHDAQKFSILAAAKLVKQWIHSTVIAATDCQKCCS